MRKFIHKLGLNSQGRITFMVVVVIGYVVGVLTGFQDLSVATIVISAVLTLAYLYMGFNDELFFARYRSNLATAVYFVIILTLALTIQLLLGPGGSWLISLPIAGLAVQYISGLGRWVVYLLIIAGIAVPLGINVGWMESFFFTLTFSPAIVFVVVFTRLVIAAEEAQHEAEQLAAQLEEANKQLAAYATQAEELATTKERNRLAREIHDNLGHYLTVVNVQIKAAKAIMTSNPDKAQDALSKAQTLTEEGLSAVRQSVAALREDPLGERPLPAAIQDLLLETQNSGIVAEFELRGEYTPQDSKTELTLYRAVQEGLTNVRKHAHASRVDVTLDYSSPQFTQLIIADNGVGADRTATGGFGLLGIQERVTLLGGGFQVTTNPGEGFGFTLTLPDQEKQHDNSAAARR